MGDAEESGGSDAEDEEEAMALESPEASSSGPEEERTFAVELADNHAYLGPGLAAVEESVDWAEDAELASLPLLRYPGLVPLPGQHFPLYNLHPRLISLFNRVVEQRKGFFGLLPLLPQEAGTETVEAGASHDRATFAAKPRPPRNVGTLCRVRAFSSADDVLRVRAVGLRPFRLLKVSRGIDGSETAQTAILHDSPMGQPLAGHQLASSLRFRRLPRGQSGLGGGRWDLLRAWRWSPVPRHVALAAQPGQVRAKLLASLVGWVEPKELEVLASEEDLGELSWAVGQALFMDLADKTRLLGLRGPMERLTFLQTRLDRLSVLGCGECGRPLGDRDAAFTMSSRGPVSAFVNPHGAVHDLLTLRSLRAVAADPVTPPTEENSWFPGYAWSILVCKGCRGHVGWRFTRAPDRPDLRPRSFVGLTRTGIRLLPKVPEGHHPLFAQL